MPGSRIPPISRGSGARCGRSRSPTRNRPHRPSLRAGILTGGDADVPGLPGRGEAAASRRCDAADRPVGGDPAPDRLGMAHRRHAPPGSPTGRAHGGAVRPPSDPGRLGRRPARAPGAGGPGPDAAALTYGPASRRCRYPPGAAGATFRIRRPSSGAVAVVARWAMLGARCPTPSAPSACSSSTTTRSSARGSSRSSAGGTSSRSSRRREPARRPWRRRDGSSPT